MTVLGLGPPPAIPPGSGPGRAATGNPKETQALTTLKASSTPPALREQQRQASPTASKKQKGAKPTGSNKPASAVAGSVDVTPTSMKAPDAGHVPSVVVESSSHEKTLPERPAPRRDNTPGVRRDNTPGALPPSPATNPKGKQERPPTGEWFSAESKLAGSAGYDDDFDDLPRKNRAPLIIGGVVGGLGLAVIAVIALLPKPQHKPLRGEEALNQPAATASATPASAAPASAAPANVPSTVAPTPAKPATTGASAAPTATAANSAAAPATRPIAPTGATPAPVVAAKPATVTPPPAIVQTPKAADKPARVEKPAVAMVAPVEKPVISERPKDKPARADRGERADKIDKPSTRVAANADKSPPATDKRKKAVPEGFKDPFATEPSANKANESAQAEFFVKLGRQKLNADELPAAAANFNKAREYDARSSEAIAGLGEVAFEQGDYNGAAVHLKQALRFAPNRSRYLVLLGQTYYKLGKPKEAVGEYKKALRIDPGNQEAQHSLEVAERKLNGG